MQDVLKIIKTVHRFYQRRLFYALVLSSFLAGGLFALRVGRAGTLEFRNLVWNLMLAWVPYLASLLAASLHQLAPRRWWLLILPGSLWLLFFPNAPYIVTDFLHLEPRQAIPLWYDILLIASFAWTGLILAFVSLRIIQRAVEAHLGRWGGWIFATTALLLAGLGIYLGRFSRFNSWDLLLQPREVLLSIVVRLVDPLTHLSFFVFTALFTTFLAVIYLSFVAMHNLNEFGL